jgi:hypothetical protein
VFRGRLSNCSWAEYARLVEGALRHCGILLARDTLAYVLKSIGVFQLGQRQAHSSSMASLDILGVKVVAAQVLRLFATCSSARRRLRLAYASSASSGDIYLRLRARDHRIGGLVVKLAVAIRDQRS